MRKKLVENSALPYSGKGVSKKHNHLYFERYKDVLDVFQKTGIDSELEGEDIDKVKNVGFRVHDQGIVRYEQKKLGLSAYYDKRYVLTDGFYTRRLELWPLNNFFESTQKSKNVIWTLFLYMGVPKRSQSYFTRSFK